MDFMMSDARILRKSSFSVPTATLQVVVESKNSEVPKTAKPGLGWVSPRPPRPPWPPRRAFELHTPGADGPLAPCPERPRPHLSAVAVSVAAG